jgi:hypothetical protein
VKQCRGEQALDGVEDLDEGTTLLQQIAPVGREACAGQRCAGLCPHGKKHARLLEHLAGRGDEQVLRALQVASESRTPGHQLCLVRHCCHVPVAGFQRSSRKDDLPRREGHRGHALQQESLQAALTVAQEDDGDRRPRDHLGDRRLEVGADEAFHVVQATAISCLVPPSITALDLPCLPLLSQVGALLAVRRWVRVGGWLSAWCASV